MTCKLERFELIGDIAPFLPSDLLVEALAMVRAIIDEDQRKQILDCLSNQEYFAVITGEMVKNAQNEIPVNLNIVSPNSDDLLRFFASKEANFSDWD